MPFILPTLMLLERAPLIQSNLSRRVKFLKNIFYFRVSSYFSFFLINQITFLL
jgi:hypothetical protein